MVRSAALALLVACAPGGPRFEDGAPEVVPASAAAPLSPVLRVALDRPGGLEILVDDARGSRTLTSAEPATVHEIPLLGHRAGDEVRLTVRAFDDRGASERSEVVALIGDLPERFPIVEVLAHDRERAEPGLRLVSTALVSTTETLGYFLALDEDLEVVWVLEKPAELDDLRIEPDGSLYSVGNGSAWALGPLGDIRAQWGREPEEEAPDGTFVAVDVGKLHHEVFPLDGELLALSKRRLPVEAYPCSYERPAVDCGPADLQDTRLVRFTREGEVLLDVSMAELLDPFRIGFLSLDLLADGARDWAHGNAAIPMPDGGWLVSVRHQDALVALTEEGELRWILADPAGWPERLRPFLLTPAGEGLRWPYHAHGPTFDADGVLWMFDNHNEGRTPYTEPVPGPVFSRVVGFRIDELARTVTQVASFEETATGPLFSRAFGNAAVLPTTGNVLGTYGMPLEQGGVSHASLGYGTRVVTLVEWSAEGDLVSDVRLRSDAEVEKGGWRAYRAVHAPSLYPDGVER